MDDLARIYTVSISSKETSIGLITVIIFSILTLIMLCSLIFLYMERFKNNFLFLSTPSWFSIIIGVIFLLSAGLTKLGEVTDLKCHLY